MTTKTLAEAFLAAQKRLENPKKTKTATVKGTSKKTGQAYEMSYSYASLDDTMAAALKALHAEDIALLQPMVSQDGRVGVKNIIVGHGEQMDLGTLLMPTPADAQTLGSLITYLRRYSLGSVGLVAEDDDDGAGATHLQETEPAKADKKLLDSLREESKRAGVTDDQYAEDMEAYGVTMDTDLTPEQAKALGKKYRTMAQQKESA